jgi:hypothetical protein
MRRSVVAVIGALAMRSAVAATAGALTTDDDSTDAGHQMQGMMSGSARGSSGWMGHWMQGAGVDSEFEYLTEMIAHHEEAVAAAAELDRSDRPQMGRSARRSWPPSRRRSSRWSDGPTIGIPGAPPTGYQPMTPDLFGLSGDRLDQAFLQGTKCVDIAPPAMIIRYHPGSGECDRDRCPVPDR